MFCPCEEEATVAAAAVVGCHGDDDAVYGQWRRRLVKVQPL